MRRSILWQAAARPGDRDVAEWIHEGAANAIAAEALVSLGMWDAEDYAADLNMAREECAKGLRGGALARASARRDYKAVYACGQVIAVAVSAADERTTGDFWRAFIEGIARQSRL